MHMRLSSKGILRSYSFVGRIWLATLARGPLFDLDSHEVLHVAHDLRTYRAEFCHVEVAALRIGGLDFECSSMSFLGFSSGA